jgi:hypothetical protein
MSFPQFSDGTKRILRDRPSLPSAHTRELGIEFSHLQRQVCLQLGALGYPLERMVQELQSGSAPYFREGADQDRKEGGKKTGYRFAGISPSLGAEYLRQREALKWSAISVETFRAWESDFLCRFTFEVVEQIALRAEGGAAGAENGIEAGRRDLHATLAAARGMRDRILSGNLLLVAQIAIRRGRLQRGFSLDDLFAAGTDGLIIAINRYDPSVALFSTYATPWISMAIDRYAANNRHVIRLPIGLQEKIRRLGDGAAGMIPSTVPLEEPVVGAVGEADRCIADFISDPAALKPHETMEQSDVAQKISTAVTTLDGLKEFIIALRNDIGDPAALAAALFRREADLSLSRGRASAAAAAKTLDRPAKIRFIVPGDPSPQLLEAEPQIEQPRLAVAV